MTRLFPMTMALGLLVGLSSVAGASHPIHNSLTEMEWNPKTSAFEVAVGLWPDDLENALSKHSGEAVKIDEAENLDELLSDYLQARFKLSDEKAKPIKFRWVGHEIGRRKVWVYMEFSTKSDPEKCVLQNTLLHEIFDDQVNLVNLNREKQHAWLAFDSDHAKQRIDFSAKLTAIKK